MAGKKLKGKVISDKMEKTVVVAVDSVVAHPVYGKRVRITSRLKAHDELGAKVGDKVVIQETRPLSKDKRWRVVEISGKEIEEKPAMKDCVVPSKGTLREGVRKVKAKKKARVARK